MSALASHDYLVIGSGSAGAVVARRLVDAGADVGLIEAGGPDTNPAIHDPARWPELSESADDWALLTDPQEALGGRRLSWPRGKVLGGTSAMNGMAYIRGHPLDYDGWAYHGCPGWSFEDVLPLFKRSEDFDAGESEFHGSGGPMRVTTLYEPHPLIAGMVAASQEAGIPFNADHNGATLDGVGYTQLITRDGRRETAATSFLAPVMENENLTVYTHANVRRLRFSGRRCSGVDVALDGDAQVIEASVEVVVCAGAIGSPKLLMLSGIGPAGELGRLGIDSVADLPGVGANLHDHLLSPVIFSSPKPIPPALPGLSQLHGHLFWRSRPGLVVPDTQPLCFHMPLYREAGEGPPEAYTILGGLIRPDSRGALRLRSANPDDPLSLDPRCLTCDSDLEALTASVELSRDIGREPGLNEWTREELFPGPGVRTHDELREYVRQTAASYHHQVGTCKMGSDADAVVDPELRVVGVEGLRVADASVMPFISSGNTHAPTTMIGEKASDLLLGRG